MKISIDNFFTGCFLTLLLTPFYLYTMNPSVSVGDSGEFIAAASALALPHAPSYPLFSLLGKCALLLNPLAHSAYRVNLVSVFLGVATAVLFFYLSLQIGCSRLASLIATLTLFFSNILWEHSITSEVFTLNSFFAVFILLLFSMPSLKGRLFLCSFLTGLGLGNHHTLIVVVPAVALLYIREHFAGNRPPALLICRQLSCALLFWGMGFSIYIFLPIRSMSNPPLDWSNPETLQNFWRVVTRADYGSLSLTLGEKLPRTFATAVQQASRYLSFLAREISWLGLAGALLGWIVWFRKERIQSIAFLTLFFVSGILFLILGNLPFDSISSGILPRFYLMPSIPLLLALGCFFEWVKERKAGVAVILGFSLPFYILWNAHGHRTFSRDDFVAYDYGRNLLRSLPPNAALFMDGGDDTFYTLAYFTIAEKRRKELELHDRGGLIFPNPYGDDFRKISKTEKEMRRQKVEGSYLNLRPLFYSTFNREILKGAFLIPKGILYEAVDARSAASLPAGTAPHWHLYSYRGVYETVPGRPYRQRALLPLYPFLQTLESWELARMRRAVGFGADILWLQSNCVWETSLKAYALSSQNKFEEAGSLYKFILEVDPKFVSAYTNLGVLAERKNEWLLAETYYQKAIEADPSYSEAYYNLGVLYWKQSRWEDVIQLFERTLQLNPNHPSAAHFLSVAKNKLNRK